MSAFNPVSLSGMDSVKLLDRVDIKYVFPAHWLHDILKELSIQYQVLEIDGRRQSRYETVYFDTDDLQLYRIHHNGKANRFKLRIRKYLDSGESFYEFKVRNQKKRTLKQRVEWKEDQAGEYSTEPFLRFSTLTLDNLPNLHPSLVVHYTRITLVRAEPPERLTIDTNLSFNRGTVRKDAPPVCIAEVKMERNGSSLFRQLMHRRHMLPLRVSKYCLGLITHCPALKKNNFKPRMSRLEKIAANQNPMPKTQKQQIP